MIHQFVAAHTDANLHFEITLEKGKRVYWFISENGVGKTNLLENMAKTLIYAHSMFRRKHKQFKYSGIVDLTSIHSQLQDSELRLAKESVLEENPTIRITLNCHVLDIRDLNFEFV